MVLWVLIRAMLYMRALLARWHAFMFLGPRHVGGGFLLLKGGKRRCFEQFMSCFEIFFLLGEF
jgi:hypothetical protein